MKQPLWTRWVFTLSFILFALTGLTHTTVSAQTPSTPTVVYFYEALCEGCQELDRLNVVETLEAQGITVIIKDLAQTEALARFAAYNDFYQVPNRQRSTPLMFAGEDFYSGANTIIQALASGRLQASAQDLLVDVPDQYIALAGWAGLGRVILAGLIDSVNPCAIAMLLMFISLVGVLKDRKLLITISLSYITAIFVTYFLIGVALLSLMRRFATQINAISTGLYVVFAILCLFLAWITLHDFVVTRKQEYGKIKNQLPKPVRAFNERFMKRFTETLGDRSQSTAKRYTFAVVIPFFIGVVVAFTEAACTGQVYGLVLLSIRTVPSVTGYLYLLVFNLLFIAPLIVIAVVAVYANNIMGVSNFVRERMPAIKLATGVFFILMMFYFLLDAFNFSPLRYLIGVFS